MRKAHRLRNRWRRRRGEHKPQMTGRQVRREHAIAVVLVLSFALLSAQLSVQLRAATLPGTLVVELDALRGYPRYPEFQNRILSPLMQVALREIFPANVSDKSVWFALRVLQAGVAYLVLYWVAFGVTGGRLRALAATALVTFAYAWTPLSHPWEYTSDFLDILFMSLFIGLALAERSIVLTFVVIVAATNRESAAFAGVIWIALATVRYGPWPEQWRRFALGVFYIVLATTIAVALRVWLSADYKPGQNVGLWGALREWRWILHPDGAFPLLIAMAASFFALLRGVPRPWTTDQVGLGLAAATVLVFCLVFGIFGELRVFLPVCVLLSFVAVMGANGRSDKEWLRFLAR
jgi:hypothetical protein